MYLRIVTKELDAKFDELTAEAYKIHDQAGPWQPEQADRLRTINHLLLTIQMLKEVSE